MPRPHVKPAAAPTMDLNLLAIFDALWTERSVTRAGKRMGLSQPAMSGALARLRLTLGDPLFVRDKLGLRPTERAAELAEPIASALASLRAAVRPTAFAPESATRAFTIGCVDAAIAVIVPAVLDAVLREAPRARIFVRPLDPSEAPALLASGAIDVAIVPLGAQAASVVSEGLFPIEGVLAMREHHPLSRKKSLSARDLLLHPHAKVSFEGRSAGQVDEALAKEGLARHVGVVVSSYLAIPPLLRGTDLLALVPRPFARAMAKEGLAIRPLPTGVRFPRLTMGLSWARAQDTSAASRWLRGHIVAAATRVLT